MQRGEAGDFELVALTSLEFELLFLMASRPGRVWSRTELLDRTRGMDYVGDDRAVHTYMRRLRLKISPANQPDRFIRTVTGVGYKFEDE